MANELEVELLEVEILESRIRRLESMNQDLLQENRRLTSTVALLESTNSNLDASNNRLLQENDRLRSIVSDLEKTKSELETLKIDLREREKALELENLFARTSLDDPAGDRDSKSEQIERLLSEIEELQRSNEEVLLELRKVKREKAELAAENERLENRIDRISEDNTVLILTVLTAQSDLEADLVKQTEIIRDFFQRAVLMVRKTAEMLERGGEEMEGGDFAEGYDEAMDSTVEMLLRSLEVELAGVKRAFRERIAGNEGTKSKRKRKKDISFSN